MDGILIAVLALLAFIAGIAVQRWLLVRADRGQIKVADKKAQRLIAVAEQEVRQRLSDAEEEAQQIASKAQEDAERIREEARKAKKAFAQERQDFGAELDAERRRLERFRHNVDRNNRKNRARTKRLNDRQRILKKASNALKKLEKETKTTQKNAEKLGENVKELHRQSEEHKQLLIDRETALAATEESLEAKQEELNKLISEQVEQLAEVANLSVNEAKEELKKRLIDTARTEASAIINRMRDEAKQTGRRKAQEIVLTSIQRTAASMSVDHTVSVVHLESEAHKGRVIGREGRNIRAFEAASGTEVIVDDTPGAVVISCFDSVRREIARRALQRLVKDGRIHPVRIEREVKRSKRRMDEEVVEAGERATIDLQIHGLHPELIRLVGCMKFRFSYGQNLLAHSIETARIASLIAAELGIKPALVRRAGLLHDIGKVITESTDRPHALVGMDFCKRYREDPTVCNAVGAHHDEIEMTALISPIVQAADAISGARPGARRANVEAYIRRLEDLEKITSSFEGVQNAYVFSAGREIRAIVNESVVDDTRATELAQEISERIEEELQYPGQIHVTVIRELRASATAK